MAGPGMAGPGVAGGAAVKLGNETVGLRKRVESAELDEFDDPVTRTVDVKVRWCSITPTRRTSENDESEDRTAPMTTGMTWLAPPSTPVDAVDLAVWPITGETTVDGVLTLSGPVWQVVGEPGPWAESLEVQLRKAT
jgi:hypothetical protein